jgi:hypothetical protein
MPVLQEGAIRAACAHDQVDAGAGEHALGRFIPTTMIGDRTAANHGNAHGVGISGRRRIKVLMSFSAASSALDSDS